MSDHEAALGEVVRLIDAHESSLPTGFPEGLKKQFAALLSPVAWADEDQFPAQTAVSQFLSTLAILRPEQRPGIGTDGRGSLLAFWHDPNGKGRVSINFVAGTSAASLLVSIRPTE